MEAGGGDLITKLLPSPSSWLVLLFLVLMISSRPEAEAAAVALDHGRDVAEPAWKGGVFFYRVHVYVQNDLGPKMPLRIHCKSKDDDLGEHQLENGMSFEWSFHINFWRTTLFWCDMWGYDNEEKEVHGTHDVYKAIRTWKECEDHCYWSIRKDGWYLGPSQSEFSLKYNWDSQ